MLRCLVLFLSLTPGSASAQSSTKTAKPSYWPTDGTEVAVEIDGHGFDFEKAKKGRGIIDGPWNHNGRYRLRANAPGVLDLELQFGTDAKQCSDMAIAVRIERGRASIRGKVKGKNIGKISVPVQRRGKTFVLRIEVRSKAGKTEQHVIRWKTA